MTRMLCLALLSTAALGGCAALQHNAVEDRESQLSAAGFSVLPANTPSRQAMLATLPPNHVSQIIRGDTVSYVYPDQVICHCLYTGGQQAFAQYAAYVQQRRIADEQVTAAQIGFDGGWDWGPWGGYGGWR